MNVSLPSLYPLALSVHVAFEGVPPDDEFPKDHVAILELKLSLTGAAFSDEFEVAEEVKLTVFPKQVEAVLADAVTAVGVGLTTKVFDAVTVPQLPPLEVNVNVTVPV